MDTAINNLGSTIQSINAKVQDNRDFAYKYHVDIIEGLSKIRKTLQNADLKQFQTRGQELESTRNQLAESNQRLSSVTHELEQLKTTTHNEVARLQATITQMQNNVDLLTNEKTQRESELNNQTNELQQLQAQLNTDKNASQQQIQDLNAQITEKQRNIDELNGQKDQCSQELERLTNSMQELESQKNEALANHTNQQQILQSSIDKIQKLTLELKSYADKIDSVKSSLNDSQTGEMFKGIFIQIDGILNSLTNQNATNQNATNQNATNQSQANTATPKLSVDDKINKLLNLYKTDRTEYNKILKNITPSDKIQFDSYFEKYPTGSNKRVLYELEHNNNISFKGGKRKRKHITRKRMRKRLYTRKRQRGGYIYHTSKKLDKSSSVISTSKRGSKYTRRK